MQFTYTSPTGDEVTWGDGTELHGEGVSGLDGFDPARSSTSEIPRGHGGVPGQHFLPAREPVFELTAAPSGSMTELREQTLRALTVSMSEDGVLSWGRPDEPRRMMFCRPLAVSWPSVPPSERLASVKVAFEASDPRMYSAAGKQVSLDPYTSGGGVDGPVDGPKDAEFLGSDESVDNVGNSPAPTVVRFYGPTTGICSGVTLTDRTHGVSLEVVTDIAAGQILTVDMRAFVASTGARVVDLSGSNRYGAFQQPRVPFMVEPGSSVLRFVGSGVTTGMRCVVDWADTYLS